MYLSKILLTNIHYTHTTNITIFSIYNSLKKYFSCEESPMLFKSYSGFTGCGLQLSSASVCLFVRPSICPTLVFHVFSFFFFAFKKYFETCYSLEMSNNRSSSLFGSVCLTYIRENYILFSSFLIFVLVIRFGVY